MDELEQLMVEMPVEIVDPAEIVDNPVDDEPAPVAKVIPFPQPKPFVRVIAPIFKEKGGRGR